MKKLLLIINTITFLSALGVETLNIPPTANAVGTSGAGIASPLDIWINPVAIHKTEKTNIRFTYFRWLGNIPGNQIAINWRYHYPQHLALESSTINDLELYSDIPQEKPLGKFSVSWISTVYCIGLNTNGVKIGFSLRANYSRLYTETMTGLTSDMGIVYNIDNNFQIGFIIKNFGIENSDNLRTVLPIQFGAGISYIEPILLSSLLFDFIKDKNNGNIIRLGIRKSFDKLNILSGATIQNNEVMTSGGISFNYRNWEISWGVLIHSTSALGIPQYIDISWYF